MTLTIVDFVFIGCLIGFFVMGCVKGFLNQVFKLISLVICVFGTFLFYKKVADLIITKGWINNGLDETIVDQTAIDAANQSMQNNANLIGFVVTLGLMILICLLIKFILGKFTGKGSLKLVDRILGGVLSAVVVWALFGAAYSIVGAAVEYANNITEQANGILKALSGLLQMDVEEGQPISNFMQTEFLDKLFGAFNPIGDWIMSSLTASATAG